MRGHALQTLDELHQRLPQPAPRPIGPPPSSCSPSASRIAQEFRQCSAERLETVRIRCHGDYHLGQLLFTGKDFVVVDFEGNAGVPLSERRIKRSPLSDVACLRCSLEPRPASVSPVVAGSVRADARRPASHGPPATSSGGSNGGSPSSAAHLPPSIEDHPGIAPLLPAAPQGTDLVMHVYRLEQTLQNWTSLSANIRTACPRRSTVCYDLVRSGRAAAPATSRNRDASSQSRTFCGCRLAFNSRVLFASCRYQPADESPTHP